MKLKASKHSSSLKSKLGLPAVLFACSFFFVAGFFFSSFLSQDASGLRQGPRMLESVNEERAVMPRGETGDDSFTTISFQVLSWVPRALYFPNFAPAEHCQSVIEMAKIGLKPSTLALRKGETADNTKGIRTRYTSFLLSGAAIFVDMVVEPKFRLYSLRFRKFVNEYISTQDGNILLSILVSF
ncbi:hypothetical protein CRG98_038345 [Punica granatum]|uniref:Uncharacterized protein n=1 Tax=Punica granatum TaxID=22663 RepID=A0A2I0IBQ2_PUNGR|nr:hypothetical protein CRG98_038345 [Punica granatum]